MYLKHKIIPKGAISWDNQGNNKAYQSRQVIFALNPSSIYAHLAESDKELYDVTGMLPCRPARRGAIEELTTAEWMLFKHNPYPEVAKGLVEYYMDPENLRIVMEEGGGRWGPPFQGCTTVAFWQSPKFQHWRVMLERGRQFASPGTMSGVWRGTHHQRPRPYDAPRAGGQLGGREGRRRGTQQGGGDLRPVSRRVTGVRH